MTVDQKYLKANVWLVEGRLFSLEFSHAPRQFFAGIGQDDTQTTVSEVIVWVDSLKSRISK